MPGVMNYKDYYMQQLSDGQEYQDFVAEQLYRVGLPLFNYASKKYQQELGENKLGVEIKLQKLLSKTGNLWIEVQEKSNPKNHAYVPSGIFRKDNTWLFVTGDTSVIYVFAKTLLCKLVECEKYNIIENKTKTSKGFLMPKGDAEKYAAKIITPEII